MMFNTRTKALSTAEARQAVAMAIDRKRIVDQAMAALVAWVVDRSAMGSSG